MPLYGLAGADLLRRAATPEWRALLGTTAPRVGGFVVQSPPDHGQGYIG